MSQNKTSKENIDALLEYYQVALENLPHPYAIINTDTGEIVIKNHKYIENLNELPIKEQNNLYEILKDKTITSHIYNTINTKGDNLFFEIEMTPIIGSGEYVIKTIQNITQTKKLEERLDLFEKAITFSPDTFLITDINGIIQYVNPNSFTKIYEYMPEEVIGKKIGILKSGNTPIITYESLRETIQTGDTWTGTLSNKTKSGKEIIEEASISPLFNKKNEIIGFVTIKKNTHRRKLEEQNQHYANYDILTGLINRKGFYELIEMELNETRKNKFAIFYLDLDGFKNVNDTYGHLTGDKTLIETGRRFNEIVRDTDVVSRIGGDEFGILIKNYHNIADLKNIAKKIIYSISMPYEILKNNLKIGTSIGISLYDPKKPKTLEELITESDIAMYYVKENKKNNFKFYNSTFKMQK